MIIYRPSVGNTRTPVGTDEEGNWFGESIGGNILLAVKKKERFPYKTFDSALSSSSTWFYPPVTDYDYINGTTFYRAIYIGASEEDNVTERLGTIEASYTVNTTDMSASFLADQVFDVDLYYEGQYTILNGSGSIVLEAQEDIGNQLPSAGWSKSLSINKDLAPGQYIKVWVRTKIEKDIQLLDYDDFDYTVTVGSLSIRVSRETGRLNISKVYSTSLNFDNLDSDYKLKESLPFNFQFDSIIKVITHLEYINVWYFDDENFLNNLIIKRGENVFKNKYINVKITNLGNDIEFTNEYLYTTFSECLTVGSTGTTGTSGTSTSGTSGIVGFSPSTTITPGTTALSGSPEDFLEYKFIYDIYSSEKEANNFYIFFNEFVTDILETDEFIEKYGHRQWSWNTAAFYLDLRYINDTLFELVDEGFDNKKDIISNNDLTEISLKKDYFIKSITLVDDLFIGLGFLVEDCRITNNFTQINYIWEKDLIKGVSDMQQSMIPRTENNYIKSPENYSNELAYLTFGDINQVDYDDFDAVRKVETLSDGKETVNMGSPHGNRIHHGYTYVSYDIPEEYDQFSSTWSFGVEIGSVATPASTDTTGVGTSGTTGTSGTPCFSGSSGLFDMENTYHNNLKLQSVLNSVSNFEDTIGVFSGDSWVCSEGYKSIFKMHCRSNEFEYALNLQYDFSVGKWKLITKDYLNNDVETIIDSDGKISFLYDNVITINTTRVLIYGCGKKYYINFNLYVNGQLLTDGVTYTENTTDSYIITHNNNQDFSGWLSYWEVRDALQQEGENYAKGMFDIFSNKSWAQLETISENTVSDPGFEEFNFKQSILLNNLYIDGIEDDIVYPIVLQGNGYAISDEINLNVRRSVFDFSNISTLNPSFAFTYEGISKKLDWFATPYDFNKDRMVVWVKLNRWSGQRLTMYLSDVRLISDETINNPYKDNYFGVWHMNGLLKQNVMRYDDQKVFTAGEGVVSVSNSNGNFLIQLDRQYPFGIPKLYKSNYFDLEYDDRRVVRDREEEVADFLTYHTKYLSPSYMEIRKVKSLYPLLSESDAQTDNGVE